ncbi:uracil-DNA glycosylase-like [Ruditapes philippinarum]|uniref:uracil-DNA glycosylase-like n=1 Tax=Ruditapes philippinarum TaxID=129788 RepID=UPI00295B3B8F|nr:uracil-DNA glycosylase-like [Ruditapes philippinarum]
MPRKRKADTELEELEDMVQTKRVAKGKKQKLVKETTDKVKAQTKTSAKVKEVPKKNTKVTKEKTTGRKKATAIVDKPQEKTKGKNSAKSTGNLDLKGLLKDGKWKDVLAPEFEQPYFKSLEETLQNEYDQGKEIFPPRDLIFNALHLTPLEKVRVVILGQDPYHDNGQAMGLSFSVPKDIAVPPSLRNMYNELERDPKIPGFKKPDHGCLVEWANEGVLMLNATLTVEAHKANSHAKFGWQTFTDAIIKVVSENCDQVAFILWGGFAHKKEKLIDTKKHATIKTAHPSPLSLNKFKNCNCFSDCDDALVKFGLTRINWNLS